MNLSDVDWSDVLRGLSRWYPLPLAARRLLLHTLTQTGSVPVSRFGLQFNVIVRSGIAVFDTERRRLTLAEPHRLLMNVLRSISRHPVFDAPSSPVLVKYMEEHFSQEEIRRLSDNPSSGWPGHVARTALASRVTSVAWPRELVVAKSDNDLLKWAAARGRTTPDDGSLSDLRELQGLAGVLVERGRAISLRELAARQNAANPAPFVRALHMGLATLVLFVGLDSEELEPTIGLWPEALTDLIRPPAMPPTQAEPVEHFEFAVLMEDMTALLAAVAAAPMRLRANEMLVFARTRTEIESRLVAIPPWAASVIHNAGQSRVDATVHELLLHQFVRRVALHNMPHLEIAESGTIWLALSPRDRLAALLAPLRASKSRNPPSSYRYDREDRFFPFTMPYYKEPAALNLRADLTRAFLSLPGGFVGIAEFLEYASREANPLDALPRAAKEELFRHMHYGGAGIRSEFAGLWSSALQHFLSSRLVMLGGARLGVTARGVLCFALTDVGRYLLGDIEQFAYGVAEVADVVVQPNFDVIFLSASPALEARMGRVAERVGKTPGLAFRITRASILRAAESGVTISEIVAILADASSKPLPKNVQREIVGWVASIRRAHLRRIEVIDCADAESADRVNAALGNKVRRLTATMLEIVAATSQARAALLKRLRSAGVFLSDETGRQTTAAPKPRRIREADEFDVDFE